MNFNDLFGSQMAQKYWLGAGNAAPGFNGKPQTTAADELVLHDFGIGNAPS